MVGQGEVVVNRLGHAEEALRLAGEQRVIGELLDGVHGVVAADIDEALDVQLVENIENLQRNGPSIFTHLSMVNNLNNFLQAAMLVMVMLVTSIFCMLMNVGTYASSWLMHLQKFMTQLDFMLMHIIMLIIKAIMISALVTMI